MNGCDIVWSWPISTGLSAYATEQEAPGMKSAAFHLPDGVQDDLRYALRPQESGLGSRVGPNGFDHRGVFADAVCVRCRRLTCDSHQREQQQSPHHPNGLQAASSAALAG